MKEKKKILIIETGGTFATEFNGKARKLKKFNEQNEDVTKIYNKLKMLFGTDRNIFNCLLESKIDRIMKFDASQVYSITKKNLSIIENIEFTTQIPFEPILSENMNTGYWEILIKYLKNIDYDEYDGIIITHGTDTLAYTSNLFSIIFSNVKIPIVFVSSNHPLNQFPESNGIRNFMAATYFILKEIAGVYVVYCNQDGKTYAHFGSRLLQMTVDDCNFRSYQNAYLGTIVKREFRYNNITENNWIIEGKKNNLCELSEIRFKNKCLYIGTPYVGMDFTNYKLDNVKAILCGTYHSGTICTEAEDNNSKIQKIVNEARKKGIVVFIGGIRDEQEIYESISNITGSEGIYFVKNMSLIAIYTKIIIAINKWNEPEEIYKFVQNTNISGEYL